eukprot:snap_masked-scaffold_88-processed-gene-0.30-mRNA-1 protein AED:1.00 eAED:1.00 QI:0/-1/0/0/-1/1/1/0/91
MPRSAIAKFTRPYYNSNLRNGWWRIDYNDIWGLKMISTIWGYVDSLYTYNKQFQSRKVTFKKKSSCAYEKKQRTDVKKPVYFEILLRKIQI